MDVQATRPGRVTSSFCASNECIELEPLDDGTIAFHCGGVTLTATKSEFDAWLRGAKGGEFDHLTA